MERKRSSIPLMGLPCLHRLGKRKKEKKERCRVYRLKGRNGIILLGLFNLLMCMNIFLTSCVVHKV